MNRSDLLLIRGKPNAGESLMGYIIRLTEQNGYPSPSWIVKRAELNYGINRSCSFVYKSPETLRGLSNLTGASISELAAITYSPEKSYRYDSCLFYGNALHQSFVRLGYPKLCPDCLSESPYCRRVWDLPAATTCLKHKSLLMDECPRCMRRISWVRSRVSFCPCEFDWREAKAISVKETELVLTRHLYYLCGLSVGERGAKDRLRRGPAMELGLKDFLSALYFFAGLYQGISASTGIHLLPKGRNKEFHTLFTTVYCIFEDWPNYFYDFLHWWRTQQRDIPSPAYQRLKSVLYKEFENFYTGLYKVLSGYQFNFIKNAFMDYLSEEWEGCDLSIFAWGKSRQKRSPVRFVSKSDAIRLLDADDKQINHFIRTGRLKTKVRSKGMKRLIFIDVADIAELFHEIY